MDNYLKIVKNFLKKNKNVRKSHQLGIIWSQEGMRRLNKYITESKNVYEAITKMQSYLVELPKKKPTVAVQWHIENLKKKGLEVKDFPSFLSETSLAPKDLIVQIQGKKFLPDIFRHFGHIERISLIDDFLRKGNKRILEVGSGTGYLPKLLKEKYKNIKYVVVDIPEMICFSYMRIVYEFPEKSVLLIDEEKTANEIDLENYDFIFCPINFKEIVFNLEYDLFINTASFGEMKYKDVKNWFLDIENIIKPKYLFTVNRYLNTLIPGQHEWRHEENGSNISFGKKWKIIDWELEPDFTRCPWNNRFARYLLVFAKFEDKENITRDKKCSKNLMEVAEKGTWNTYPLYMTIADNVLSPDLTKTGILFHLWESLRLDVNSKNLFLMLKYLDTLIRNTNRHFEEYFRYLDQLSKIIKTQKVSKEIQLYYEQSLNRFNRNPGYLKLVDVFKDYNIVKTKNSFIGLRQDFGVVDLERDRIGDKEISPHILLSNTLDEIKEKINKI